MSPLRPLLTCEPVRRLIPLGVRFVAAAKVAENECGRKRAQTVADSEWIWKYSENEVYYCVRERDTFSNVAVLSISLFRCVRMVNFLQLCDEQDSSHESRQRWLYMTHPDIFQQHWSIFQQYGRTLACLVLEVQGFFTRHRDRTPVYVNRRGSGPKALYAIETQWRPGRSPRDNLVEHLDRLYERALPGSQALQQRKREEQGSFDESHTHSVDYKGLHRSITVGLSHPSSSRRRRKGGRDNSSGSHGKSDNYGETLLGTRILAACQRRSQSGSRTLGPWCPSALRKDHDLQQLFVQWRLKSIEWRVIVSAALTNRFPPEMRIYLKDELLRALPWRKKYAKKFVEESSMDIVLGYFVLVLTEVLPGPPLSPREDKRVLKDFARTLQW